MFKDFYENDDYDDYDNWENRKKVPHDAEFVILHLDHFQPRSDTGNDTLEDFYNGNTGGISVGFIHPETGYFHTIVAGLFEIKEQIFNIDDFTGDIEYIPTDSKEIIVLERLYMMSEYKPEILN